MAERWIIDAGQPLVLPLTPRDGTVQVTEQQTPVPPPRTQFAQRPEGSLPTSREVENRTVTIRVAITDAHDAWAAVDHDFGSGAPSEREGEGDLPGWRGSVRHATGGSTADAAVSDLLGTVGALRPSAGTRKAITGTATRVLASGERIIFDVLDATVDGPAWDSAYYAGRLAIVTITMTCLPFGRSPERLLGTKTLPAPPASRPSGVRAERFLVLDDLQVPGDVPALARLELSGATLGQKSVLFATDRPDARSRTVGLQLDAESLDRPTGATLRPSTLTAMAPNSVVRAAFGLNVPATWEPQVFLRRGGTPLDVRGNHRVFCRVFADGANPVTLRLRWAAGAREGGLTENPEVTSASAGGRAWQLLDLGVVSIPEGGMLDGVLERRTPLNAETVTDVLLLVPTDCSAVLTASGAATPQDVSHADPLTGSGDVANSTAVPGGLWTSTGTGPALVRGSTGATRTVAFGQWRSWTLPAPNAALEATCSALLPITDSNNTAQVPVMVVIGNPAGIAALMAGTPNPVSTAWAIGAGFLRYFAVVEPMVWTVSGGTYQATRTHKQKGATPTSPTYLSIRYDGAESIAASYTTPEWSHQWAGSIPAPLGSDIRTGIVSSGASTLAVPPGAATVEFRSFVVYGRGDLVADQALYPTKTATIASSGSTRTTADDFSGLIASHEGDRPVLPPSGRERRPVRVTLGALRSPLAGQVDSTISPISGKVYATPRWLQVPDGS